MILKGWVRIRKSKSVEKWNEQFVNDAFWVFSIQVLYFKIMFMQMSDFASWVCIEVWKIGIPSIFAEIDAF